MQATQLVYKDPEDGGWKEWEGYRTFTVQISTFTATYHDGRQEELSCDPYPVDQVHHADRIRSLLAEGIWTQAELDLIGVKVAKLPEIPEGKQLGEFEGFKESKGVIKALYKLEDIPKPEVDESIPMNKSSMPAEERVKVMLDTFGLTKEDLTKFIAG